MTTKEEHRKRRHQKRRQSSLENPPSTSKNNDCRSAIFTAFLIGLILCLTNVALILSHIDSRQALGNIASNNGAALSTKSKNNASLRTIAKPKNAQLKIINKEEEKEESEEQEESTSAEDKDDDASSEAEPTEPPIVLSRQERSKLIKQKTQIIKILYEAGIDDLDDQTIYDLPTWKQVTDLYGDSPRIYGLDTCEQFQQHSDPAEHFVGTAGTFNSGTNLMSELLIKNCHMPQRMQKYGSVNKGIRWQVPWGKHTPVGNEEFRLSHKSKKDHNVDATNIMPAVTIRDPFVWMQSMCRIHYKAFWAHDTSDKQSHCPNLVPTNQDKEQFPWLQDKDVIPVRVKYPEFVQHHDSLVGFWNDWYGEYFNATFPRIMVRFEDLVFHAKEVTTQVCHCAGGELKRKKFQYIVQSAKKGEAAHGPMEARTSFIGAIIRYGKDTHRLDRMTQEDLAYARKALDPKLMEIFNYKYDKILSESGENEDGAQES